jgi:hypothetical protein
MVGVGSLLLYPLANLFLMFGARHYVVRVVTTSDGARVPCSPLALTGFPEFATAFSRAGCVPLTRAQSRQVARRLWSAALPSSA